MSALGHYQSKAPFPHAIHFTPSFEPFCIASHILPKPYKSAKCGDRFRANPN